MTTATSTLNRAEPSTGIVFLETLRRTWRGVILWAIGFAIMVGYVVVAIPDSKTMKQYEEVFKSSPKILLLLGGADLAAMATPEGIFALAFFSWIMIAFAIYGVIAGLAITANDEDRGIMDMMIALPIPRWRIVAERFAAYTLNTIVIALLTFAAMFAVTASNPFFKIELGRMLAACLNLAPVVLFSMTFTALVATIVRRRSTALAIAAGFVTISYLIDYVGRSIGGDLLRALSIFTYYDGVNSILKGVQIGNVLVLLVLSVAMAIGTVGLFNRRDVGL